MNSSANAYKQNMKINKPFYERVVSILRQSEAASELILNAIDKSEIEQRYVQSEKLIKLLVALHDLFDSVSLGSIKDVMQRYCVQNINLIGKLNLKNDRLLAIALRESFFEIANLWGSHKFNI